ncbi:copper homeostasis protein CutC [Actinomadura rupiterrae]|uniref:copper homeostasis protein CutC n=1 Tax=Actinomadura rupiterrae TaxID=559627 RepID=UPI0020A5CE21|nr:copper homeostasis protein CutC [Actinomadura rupiterrae]MCP2338473.1 copper homeostasis protein [Actinomadura rupiterrae]
MALLEVIALTADDARAAAEGGADRLEVVADMAADGLTPDPRTVAEMRQVTSLPIRAMLRAAAGFRTSEAELDRLGRAAADLADAGADGFVLGFLDADDAIDARSASALAAALPDGLPWTFHRALDNAADPSAGWEVVRGLGCDTVLTAGSARGVSSGLDVLSGRAAEGPASARLLMAGGGLRREHVPVLAAAGIGAFHVGTAVRTGGSWDAPLDPALVAEWRALVASATS